GLSCGWGGCGAATCRHWAAGRPRRTLPPPGEIPRVRKQAGGVVGRDGAVGAAERHFGDPPLVEPLPAPAARRCVDADRGDVARAVAGGGGSPDRRHLRALPERIRRALDVDPCELAP